MFLIYTQDGLLPPPYLSCQVLYNNLVGTIEESGIAGTGPTIPQVLYMMHSPEHPSRKVGDSFGEGTRETKFPSLEQQAWEVSDLLRVGTRDGGVMFLVLWGLGREQDTFQWWSWRSIDHCVTILVKVIGVLPPGP